MDVSFAASNAGAAALPKAARPRVAPDCFDDSTSCGVLEYG